MGTLTRKIQCQLSTSVRTPPRSTPAVPPPERTKPKTPIAFARSAGPVNRTMISESATAETTAPPSPCTARAPTRNTCEPARPQPSEAGVKSVIPTRNSRRYPKRSPNRPPSRRKPPNVSRYAFTTQASEVSEKPRSSLIDGSATFTIVESKTIIRSPRQRTTSASHRRRSFRRCFWPARSALSAFMKDPLSVASHDRQRRRWNPATQSPSNLPAGNRRSRGRRRSLDHLPPLSEVRRRAPRWLPRYPGSLPGECLRRRVGRSKLRLPCSTGVARSFSGGHDRAGSRRPGARSALRVRIPQHSSKLPRRNGRGSWSRCSEATRRSVNRRNGPPLRSNGLRTSLPPRLSPLPGEEGSQPRERWDPSQDEPGKKQLAAGLVPWEARRASAVRSYPAPAMSSCLRS